ncbi:polysaccharide pyruvyl transferase family protein [Chryseobacterium gossypii]|uniref:polysaccharide pyruvyl transferase family protein n=1 Tax=Chryseobacterium gossypii TaxID=3231602 RepID=UPI0035264DAF
MKTDIVIRGGYGFGNFGDDALMYTIVTELETVSKDIMLLCQSASYISNILPGIKVFDYHKIKQPIYSNLLIYGGGTQFYHFKKNRLSKKGLKDKILSPNHIKSYIRKKILKNNYIENKFQISDYAKHIALVGVGVGPFDIENSFVENKTANLFAKSDFVGVRDEFAMKKAKGWGVDKPVLSPDICYSFRSHFLENYKNDSKEIKKIGIIVRDWNYANGGGEYYEHLQEASARLEKEGYEVNYILFDIQSDLYWYGKRNELNIILWNPEKDTFDSFLEKISKFDLFITARFHGAIFATLLQTPFITIEVEQKLKFISETYKESSFCWERPFILDDLYSKIGLINENYNHRKNMITQKMLEFRHLSDQMFSELKEYYKTL